MGSQQSYPGLTQDIIEDYAALTYLNKGEILQHAIMQRLMNVDEAGEICQYRSKWRSMVSAYPNGKKALMKKFYSIDPEKLANDYHHRFNKEEIINKFPVLKNNPFQDRIFSVFSSKNDNCLSFEDLLDLCSVMSSECTAEVKAAWAFKIFDIDGDNQITAKDICQIVDRLTRSPHNRDHYIDNDSKMKIANVILKEINLDNSGSIGLHEFQLIMSRLPEFPSSFYFRL